LTRVYFLLAIIDILYYIVLRLVLVTNSRTALGAHIIEFTDDQVVILRKYNSIEGDNYQQPPAKYSLLGPAYWRVTKSN
jgi:hypothetical protein